MPTGLKRFQQTNQLHFITFSCYKRQPFLHTEEAKDTLQQILEQTRTQQGLSIAAYVLMPEHGHLLTNEPATGTLTTFLQILKQLTSRQLKSTNQKQLWRRRYYDFNVSTTEKFTESSTTSTATPSPAASSRNPRTTAGAASTTTPRANPIP